MKNSNPFKRILPSGLRAQLILGIALIIVLSTSLFVADLVSRQKTFFLKLNHDRGVNFSENLANISKSHVIAYELDGLENLLKSFETMPGLEYVMITSPDGVVLAHINEKYLGLIPTDSISAKLKPVKATQILLENNYTFDVASPIINHDEIVGWARVGLSQKLNEPNISVIKQRGLFYILISLIIGIIFAAIVGGRLSKGLQTLIVAAQKIREGERDLRISPTKSTEVTQLGIAINKMLDDISVNEKLLSKVLESMPVAVWILDEKGKILSVNKAGEEMWKGVKHVGIEQYNLYKAWFTGTGKQVLNHEWGAAIVLAEGRPVYNQELEIECFDKTRKIILNSAIPLRDANEKITGVITINVDITDRKNAEKKLQKINHDIGERVKELNCLYTMSQLSNNPNKTMQDMFQDCVNVIPPSFQFHEIACARIEFEGQIFESSNFVETKWKLEQNISSKDIVVGNVQVYYKEERPAENEGPFLSEERLLINSIADLLGSSAERRKAEEQSRISAERHKSIITVSNTGAWEYNSETEYLWCSPEYFSMLNRNQNDYDFSGNKNLKETWIDLLHPEDVERASNHFAEYLKGGSVGMYENYFRMKNSDGSWTWIWSRGQTLRDKNGKPTNITVGTHIDITEQKRAEQQISLEKLLSDSIINSLPGIFYMRDKNGKLIRWNKNAELFFGQNKEKANQLNTLDFVDDSQKGFVLESHKEANQKGITETIVYLKNKEQKSIPYFFTGRKLNFDTDEYVIAIGIDISERIEAENKLKERAQEIQKLSAHLESAQEEERTRIAREIHDELGQQLTGLKMDAFVAAKNIEEDKKKASEKINEMVKLIDFTIKTVRRIASDLRPGVLDDLGLMSALEWQGQEFEKRTGVKLVFESDLSDLNPERNLSTNVFRVYQEILTNITRHAKATLVETKLSVKENCIILEVRDNGQGFNFEEVKNKGSLGLIGMKERVLLFNGELGIDSRKNIGTVINLKVPIINNIN